MHERSMRWATIAVATLISACATGPGAPGTNANGAGAVPVSTPTADAVYVVTAHWPRQMQSLVESLLVKYGTPAEVAENQVIWTDNGPWKRTVVRYDPGADGRVGVAVKEVLEQWIEYPVTGAKVRGKQRPPSKPVRFSELVLPDQCRVAHRDNALVARCDNEASNFAAINLAHEIVVGKRKVQDAGRAYERAMIDSLEGKTSPYTERAQFLPAQAVATGG